MTKFQEFPLRPQGRPWPGINTRSGKLDDGTGQMTDSSVNTIINRADRLTKRKGLIRGIDERFDGSVCGLHRYTDECGREFLLVADEGGISIRRPFAIPQFGNSDAYPSDSFEEAGLVDPNFWLNTDFYRQNQGLLLVTGALNGGDLRWFKDATNFSYLIVFDYALSGDSTIVGIIKQSSGSARIEGRISRVGTVVTADMVWIDISGVETNLATANIGNDLTGRVTLNYTRNTVDNTFSVQMQIEPVEDPEVVLQDFTTLTTLNDTDLGQGTSLRLERVLTTTSPSVLQIEGRPT